MSETVLNARTAGSQPAVQTSSDHLICNNDDSTDDSTTQALEEETFFNSPPQNREAEEAVLGSVLINPETYDDLADS